MKKIKMLIASDIHGSAYYCRKLLDAYEKEGADKLILLGDLLYHGARNALPQEYGTMDVTQLLNAKSGEIIAVRGNCDSEVDQMVLDFPIMADFTLLYAGDKLIYATHGHLHGESDPPRFTDDYILLTGHTHVPCCRKHQGYVYMNPGSVSIPKGGSSPGYMVYEDGIFLWKTLDGEIFNRYQLK